MIPRVCGVSGAILCALTAASLCLAAEPMYGPGKGSVGGSLGVSTLGFDRMIGSSWLGDYSAGSIPRFSFNGQFRYVMTPSLRIQVGLGLTWTSYQGDEPAPFEDARFPGEPGKRDYLTVMVPISAQLQYVMRRGWWVYHLGAGPGLSRVWVEHHREVVKDPITKRLHRGLYLGGSGELGVEYFMKQITTTSVEFTLGGDLAVSRRDEQFPSGYNSNALAVGARVGVNYYFTPGERKKKESIEPVARP